MGRSSLLHCMIAATLLVSSSVTYSSTITVGVDADIQAIRIVEGDESSFSIEADGMARTSFLELPSLPYLVVSVLIPQGEEVVSFRLEGGEEVELSASVRLEPFAGEKMYDGTSRGVWLPPEVAVGADSRFPAWDARHTGTSGWRGYRIASFEVFPVRYDMSTGRLFALKGARLAVETSAGGTDDQVRRVRHIDGFRESTRRQLNSLVANPSAAAAYAFPDILVEDGARSFLPSYMPGLEGSEVRYLIITNTEMEAEFQRLADWKTKKGVPAVVRTVEWIEQNTRAGADLAETIRNFIQDAYGKWGVEYVLLGGDTPVIPERLARVNFYGGEFIPTDMYYECLDGSWNADGDSLWGEGYWTTFDPGDDADLYAEVFAGRLPVVTAEEARILVDKTIAYEAPSDTSYKADFLLLGEVIYPSDYNPGDLIVNDGAEYLQVLHDLYLAPDPDINSIRLFEAYPLYPGSAQLTMASALAGMDAGVNHVIHAGHGGKYNTSMGDLSILNRDARDLENGSEVFSMYLLNCDNVSFDTDCIAEHFMLNGTGGAFAVTGSSRSAFPSVSRVYLDEYYRQLFQNDIVQLGRIHVMSREPFTPYAFSNTSDRWMHFIYNYLGDPETNMYRGSPGTFEVTVPGSLAYGNNEVTVVVASGGMPFDSAHVCLYKDGDDYQYGYTDAAGQVTFADFLVRDSGTVTVTVTGMDHCLYSTGLEVEPETGAYLRLDTCTPNDDSGGNGDGMIDAGETVTLWLSLGNTGEMGGEKLWAAVSTTDPAVTVTDGISTWPDIPSGGSAYNENSITITVDAAAEDESSAEFLLEIFDSTGSHWTETFALEFHAPELELYVNTVTDSLPVGDGDGVIENGEACLVRIGIKNFGTGSADGLLGKIRSAAAGITITDSTASYGDVGSMEKGFGEGFVLAEANVGVPNFFAFELTDSHGRVQVWEMELRAPAAPVELQLDSSVAPDEIHVTWNAPDSLEAYRYLVCHSTLQGGPYEQASEDLVHYVLFRARNLEYSTQYFVVAACVDSCGNVGPYSAEKSVSTNPPQLTGWPNKVDQGCSASPSVADIDGDTHPDIVFGAGNIFAWDSGGFELLDGDNQPMSWGVFATEGSNYTASVALADLDGIPGHEIIAASWDTKEIYIFTRDGTILPGWPRTTGDLCWASPVAGDFDGDGDHEVIAYDIDGTVYIWHHDGTELLDGDGNPSTDGWFFAAGDAQDGWHVSTPALADMDEDGIAELIVAAPTDSIYILNPDRSPVAGWPVFIGDEAAGVGASPVVGDIDGDTRPEVIIQNSMARVLGLNHDGTSMTGWPQWVNGNSFFAGSAALADLTGDGRLEVVIPGMNGLCHIFRYDGYSLPGWPKEFSDGRCTESSPVIADIDSDGSLDVILGGEDGKISAWDIDGNYLAGFPIQLKNFIRGTPEVMDIDFDGDLELIASCWDENVYVWDLGGEYYRGCVKWSGFHGNRFNSGWKELVTVTDAAVTAWMYEIRGGSLTLTWSVIGDEREWDLLRRERGGQYEQIAGGLTMDGEGRVVWTDDRVREGVFYEYRLESAGGADAVETGLIEVPVSLARLYQNYPNPFNPATIIAFTIPGDSSVRRSALLNVYDVRGRLVRTLVNGPVTGGRHEISWDGRNNGGTEVSSGVYFARFASGGTRSVRKMVLIR